MGTEVDPSQAFVASPAIPRHVLAKVTMSQRAAAALEQLLPPIVARHRMCTSPASDMLAIWSAAGGELPAAELESSQFRTPPRSGTAPRP